MKSAPCGTLRNSRGLAAIFRGLVFGRFRGELGKRLTLGKMFRQSRDGLLFFFDDFGRRFRVRRQEEMGRTNTERLHEKVSVRVVILTTFLLGDRRCGWHCFSSDRRPEVSCDLLAQGCNGKPASRSVASNPWLPANWARRRESSRSTRAGSFISEAATCRRFSAGIKSRAREPASSPGF